MEHKNAINSKLQTDGQAFKALLLLTTTPFPASILSLSINGRKPTPSPSSSSSNRVVLTRSPPPLSFHGQRRRFEVGSRLVSCGRCGRRDLHLLLQENDCNLRCGYSGNFRVAFAWLGSLRPRLLQVEFSGCFPWKGLWNCSKILVFKVSNPVFCFSFYSNICEITYFLFCSFSAVKM